MRLDARKAIGAVALGTILILSTSVCAAGILTLTPAGVSQGFTLTTFATVNPGASLNMGPYGVGVLPNGNVMVNNYSNNTRYIWPDVDGQTVSSAISTITSSGALDTAFARAGGQLYGGIYPQFVQFNANGTVNHALTGVTQNPYFGMWGNLANGHVIATTNQGQIIDI